MIARMSRNAFQEAANAPLSEHEWICREEEIEARRQRIARRERYDEMPTRILLDGTRVPIYEEMD